MPRVEAKHNNGNDDKQVFVEVNAKGVEAKHNDCNYGEQFCWSQC